MAIQPIDLQTLFSQVDKVGKNQSIQREGMALQQAMQGVQLQRKTEEQIQEVNKAPETGEGPEQVNDRGRRNASGGSSQKEKNPDNDEEDQETQPSVIRDPSLGRNIDISS